MSFLPITKYIPRTSSHNNNGFEHTEHTDFSDNRHRHFSQHSLDDETYQDHLDEDAKLRTKSVPSELYRAQSLSSSLEQNQFVSVNGEPLTDISDSSVFLSSSDPQKVENSSETNEIQVENGETDSRFNLNSVGNEDATNGSINGSVDSLQDKLKMPKPKSGEEALSYLLPPLDVPVPDDWVTLEGDFVSICAAYQTHLGSDLIMAPGAHLNDGLIHLALIHSGISKQQLFSTMTALETGSHVDNLPPNMEIVKVLAFRLEPDNGKEGVIMVDGEKVDYAPLQAQVLPGICNLMAIQ